MPQTFSIKLITFHSYLSIMWLTIKHYILYNFILKRRLKKTLDIQRELDFSRSINWQFNLGKLNIMKHEIGC